MGCSLVFRVFVKDNILLSFEIEGRIRLEREKY